MGKKNNKYLKLFLSTFMLSAFTFGGGQVIVSLMKKKFVDELHWLDEEEMLNFVALAQSAPGPVAVNVSILVGHKIAGVAGAVLAILGTVLPPFLILSVISLFYTAFIENQIIQAILKGMMAGVSAVIMDVVLGMAAGILRRRKWLPVFIMVLSFSLVFFLQVNIAYIILFSGVLGGLIAARQKKTGKEYF